MPRAIQKPTLRCSRCQVMVQMSKYIEHRKVCQRTMTRGEQRTVHYYSDGDALATLKGNFNISRGGIIVPVDGHLPTHEDRAAIEYLCKEWDYAWDHSWNPAEEART